MFRFLPCLLSLALLSTACRRETVAPPNVVLVVVDTLRADRLGAYGDSRGLTPFFDQLARRGTLFERAFAASSWTMPSVASLLLSRYPSQHHVVTFYSAIAEDAVTLPERLRNAGWTTAGFSANPNIRKEAGFAQGFDELWTDPAPEPNHPGDPLRAQALATLDRTWNRGGRSPALLYLQFMEPHDPYDPPEPFRSRIVVDDDGKPFDMDAAVHEVVAAVLAGDGRGPPGDVAAALRAVETRGRPLTEEELAPVRRLNDRRTRRLYDAEVASADDQVRRMFEDLERRSFLENTVVVLTSDHGEEFGEHGGSGHGQTLYRESIRVPLILVGPGIPAGRRVAENVSLLDVAPTLLDLLGQPPEPQFEGRSLLPGMRASGPGAADIVLQLDPMFASMEGSRWVHSRGLVRGERQLLVRPDGAAELYDLATDPYQTRSVPAVGEPWAAMRESLSLAEADLAKRSGPAAPPAPMDPAHERQLRALGYLR